MLKISLKVWIIHNLGLDVTNKESVEETLKEIKLKYGKPPDIVVNSAGIINNSPTRSMMNIYLLKMAEGNFDKIIEVNLKGTFLVNQVFAEAMKSAEIKGNIINISSVAGTNFRILNLWQP